MFIRESAYRNFSNTKKRKRRRGKKSKEKKRGITGIGRRKRIRREKSHQLCAALNFIQQDHSEAKRAAASTHLLWRSWAELETLPSSLSARELDTARARDSSPRRSSREEALVSE